MSEMAYQLAAEIRLGTKIVWGSGRWARVSRCLDVPMVKLYESRAECDEVARRGRPCCKDCRGTQYHTTEEIAPLTDEAVKDVFPWRD
jgi:hypothetical protein